MADKKLLVVLGITGTQGGSVAQVFSQLEPSWRIRGITRNPSSDSAKSILESNPNIELVAGDVDDPASLDIAFDGADAIFSLTDFWQFLSPGHSTFAEAQQQAISPNRLAEAKEIQQGKTIIEAAGRAHAKHSLHRFVVSTLSDSPKWSKGAIKNNLHFDGKAKYCDYLKLSHPELAAVTSYVQIGYYLTNWFTIPAWSPKPSPGDPNKYTIPVSNVPNGKPIPFINTANDTGHLVRALITSPLSPAGTNMLGYSESMQIEEYVALWARTLGVKAEIKYLGYGDILKFGLPPWLATEISESGKYVSTYGWDGGDPDVKSPEEGGVDMSKMTSLEKWIKEQDWFGWKGNSKF